MLFRHLWPYKWIIHKDNAPTHRTLIVKDILVKIAITQLDHHAYSPNLIPSDFCLLPKLKDVLNRQRFSKIPQNVRQIQLCKKLALGLVQKWTRRALLIPSGIELFCIT